FSFILIKPHRGALISFFGKPPIFINQIWAGYISSEHPLCGLIALLGTKGPISGNHLMYYFTSNS
uniref:Uncharacterized protein n=1 Tax=Mesocestoides corti TaxID=53468 RepID=A0A5K3FUZ7_MESCO